MVKTYKNRSKLERNIKDLWALSAPNNKRTVCKQRAQPLANSFSFHLTVADSVSEIICHYLID